MQCIDVKSKKSLSKSHDSSKRTLPVQFDIIYGLLYNPGGGAFSSSQFPHPGAFANFITKNDNGPGGGGDGHRWN